jgi:diguanylate cyclase (GGDEF)-like protein
VGAVDFLAKPIEPIILKGKVNFFLGIWHQKNNLIKALAEKEILANKLKQQAEFDSLTGLPNRALFRDRLKQALLMGERSKTVGALMFIDLDRFKWVNDTLGHSAGDELLIQASERLTACIRKTDTVSRLGGDEFTVILQNVHPIPLAEIIAKKILDALAKPFQLSRREIHISGSIGVTVFPNDSNDLEELLKNADTAMYQAKESGRNAFRFFTPEMNAFANSRMALEEQLRTALEREEFVLHYQPKINLESGRIMGMEALIRWERPGVGLVFPDEFISLVEEIGLIIPLGKWVLKTACRQNQEWVEAGFDHLKMAVNISAKQLKDKDDLIQAIEEVLSTTGLAPQNLELELTESTVMENIAVGMEILEEVRSMGIQISVDDFGTGYSSLSSLKRFPIQTLKIDKSFIRDVPIRLPQDDYFEE